MRVRFPLYARILLWFFLNLLILAVLFYVLLQAQLPLGLDSLLAGRVSERLQTLGQVLAGELQSKPVAGWSEVLQNFGTAYHAQFYLFRWDGSQAAGPNVSLPADIVAKLVERHGPGAGMGRGPPPGRGPWWEPDSLPAAPQTRFFARAAKPPRQYWAAVCLPLAEPERSRARPLTLVVASDSLHGSGLFLDLTPWVVVGFGAVLFSVLFWLPLVRQLTRAIAQISLATEQIAAGRFEVQVDARRQDELGRLGQAINRMATRLAGLVNGQKRFLGDVAHELCSPLARMQLALGILEERTDTKGKAYVQDLREEVQQMSSLVNELLSFSKAGLRQGIKLVPVNVSELVAQVVAREGAERVLVQVPRELCVAADRELLTRALGNLLRNARRYAGDAGPITLSARLEQRSVLLAVSDSGPGIPEAALQQVFDPFFRVEASRSRETGGAGLGLAIVKTCVEACGGTVTAANRQPTGLEVCLHLPSATACNFSNRSGSVSGRTTENENNQNES